MVKEFPEAECYNLRYSSIASIFEEIIYNNPRTTYVPMRETISGLFHFKLPCPLASEELHTVFGILEQKFLVHSAILGSKKAADEIWSEIGV